jgi:hypothetical protein
MASAQRLISPGVERARPQIVYIKKHNKHSQSLLFTHLSTYHWLTNLFSTFHKRTDFSSNALDSFKITIGGNRETGFKNINTKARELLGDFNLFFSGKGDTWGLNKTKLSIFFSFNIEKKKVSYLFTITERGIENNKLISSSHF